MKKLLAIGLILTGFGSLGQAAVVFTENFGAPSGTTAIASYTGWENNGVLAFAGTGDLRNTTVSSGYAGASGTGNVFLTSTIGTNFQISSINTASFLAGTLDLSFGAIKSTTGSDMTELTLEYSTDGSSWTSLAIPAQATGTGTAVWRLVSFVDTALPITSTLFLKWTNSSATPSFRLDDITLSGDLATVPEPASLALIGLGAAFMLYRRQRRA